MTKTSSSVTTTKKNSGQPNMISKDELVVRVREVFEKHHPDLFCESYQDFINNMSLLPTAFTKHITKIGLRDIIYSKLSDGSTISVGAIFQTLFYIQREGLYTLNSQKLNLQIPILSTPHNSSTQNNQSDYNQPKTIPLQFQTPENISQELIIDGTCVISKDLEARVDEVRVDENAYTTPIIIPIPPYGLKKFTPQNSTQCFPLAEPQELTLSDSIPRYIQAVLRQFNKEILNYNYPYGERLNCVAYCHELILSNPQQDEVSAMVIAKLLLTDLKKFNYDNGRLATIRTIQNRKNK